MAIPKILHICWFGGKPLPKETLNYMESWKKNCPDFEIKMWNESNFDIHCCRYVEEAYTAKKWAFVADYARFYAMCHDGGVYVETDTEIIRPIDELLHYNAFFGFGTQTMTLPLCGSVKGSPVAHAMLDYYSDKTFGTDGKYDTTTVNQILFSILTSQFGLVHNNEFQIIGDNIAVYPKEYFFSTDWQTGQIKRNPKLFVIHYADSSWVDESARKQVMRKRKMIKLFGERLGAPVADTITYIEDRGIRATFKKVITKLGGGCPRTLT